jgi:hypothetical protein
MRHQFLLCTDDVNLLEDGINTIKRNIVALIDVRKEVGVEPSRENKVYVDVSSPERKAKS